MRILIVDDDEMAHQLVAAVVRILGDHEIYRALDAFQGLELARRNPPDLIISDINMPVLDGLAFTEQIRKEPALEYVPLLLLTARSRTEDKYEGFRRGADDYMVKPFDVMELQLRITALLRRAPAVLALLPKADGSISAGAVTVHVRRSSVSIGGQEVKLTASEFGIMRDLVQHADERVAPEDLLIRALGYPPKVGNPQTIHSHMRNLRAKLRGAGVAPTFLTSSHQGYMLVSEF
jgi:two-component system phosphate regulon response regulator PhoB